MKTPAISVLRLQSRIAVSLDRRPFLFAANIAAAALLVFTIFFYVAVYTMVNLNQNMMMPKLMDTQMQH